MRKLLRRPSPGLVLASVALFVALGGGAYAATSSDTKTDKKIAKKAAESYFNSNIGGASVSHANTANSAGHATSANRLTTLPSGQSESGLFASADGGSSSNGYIGLSINYPRPLAAPIDDSHVIDVLGTSATHCSGPGHADPGYLCLYDQDNSAGTYSNVYSNDGGIFPASQGALGVVLYWYGPGGYVGGSWTVTAP